MVLEFFLYVKNVISFFQKPQTDILNDIAVFVVVVLIFILAYVLPCLLKICYFEVRPWFDVIVTSFIGCSYFFCFCVERGDP